MECSLVWNHTHDFKIVRVRFEITSMISDQNCTTQSSITTFYYSHFEFSEFSQYQYLFRQVAGCSKVGNAEWAKHSIMLTWAAKIINKTNMDVFIEFRICLIFSAHGVSLTRNNCFWQTCQTSQSYVNSWSDAKFTKSLMPATSPTALNSGQYSLGQSCSTCL